jgi:light-regulated signal transduction histidine kinase (bacteriophytochrome)
MGQLIDDLLAFSRVGRHQLRMAPVAMKALANEVWLEFQEAQRAGVEFRLGELPDAAGDGALLRQVWQNLLSNALKYSAPKPSRSIEVGHTIEGGRAVYFVRDNGVGFDMQHVDRLFGVFERLHPARDFEGTGVGLALARRIVERHGGSMRAEGEVGAGATFYFTLESRGDASGT